MSNADTQSNPPVAHDCTMCSSPTTRFQVPGNPPPETVERIITSYENDREAFFVVLRGGIGPKLLPLLAVCEACEPEWFRQPRNV